MKIRNKKFNATYTSPTLAWDEYWKVFLDYTSRLYEFDPRDGWEVVDGEIDFADKSNNNGIESAHLINKVSKKAEIQKVYVEQISKNEFIKYTFKEDL